MNRSRLIWAGQPYRCRYACTSCGLRVSGRCRHCGHRQYWSPVLRHGTAALLMLFCIAALWTLRGTPVDGGQWAELLAVSAAVGLLTEFAALWLVCLRLRRETREDVPPQVVEVRT